MIRHSVLACSLLSLAALSSCTSKDDADGDAIAVVSTDDACQVAVTKAAGGTVVFDVKNEGSQATEFYLYEADGTTVAGEVENIGPGLTRQLSVDVEPGEYVTACKPGMTGDGVRGSFTVTG